MDGVQIMLKVNVTLKDAGIGIITVIVTHHPIRLMGITWTAIGKPNAKRSAAARKKKNRNARNAVRKKPEPNVGGRSIGRWKD
jgi:hypothetical protein